MEKGRGRDRETDEGDVREIKRERESVREREREKESERGKVGGRDGGRKDFHARAF